jgi:hypothetical protein
MAMRPGKLTRLLHPALNPGGYMAAAGAVYAAVVMILNAAGGHGVISVPVIVSAIAAISSLLARHAVTPVADPRGADGTQLIPVTQVATFRGAPVTGLPPTGVTGIVREPGGLGS